MKFLCTNSVTMLNNDIDNEEISFVQQFLIYNASIDWGAKGSKLSIILIKAFYRFACDCHQLHHRNVKEWNKKVYNICNNYFHL